MQIPVYDILVDHPIIYDRYLEEPIHQMHAVLIDRKHVQFVRGAYPQVKYVHFLPSGGSELAGWKPYAAREIDVLYTGSCQDIREYPHIPFLPDHGMDFYENVTKQLLAHTETTMEDAVRSYRKGKPEQRLSLQEERILLEYACKCCEWNVRRVFKQEIMRTLGAAGISVEVYGKNWEDEGAEYPSNIHYTGEMISAEECVRKIGNAKITLNIMPWFKDGAHDRVFDAMLNGSVCVTDTSKYLTDRFVHGRELVFYELDNIPQMAANVRWLLDNPETAERIAMQGYMTAVTRDTWGHRLELLMEMIEQDRAA